MAVLCGEDGQLSTVPLEFRTHENSAHLTSFNVSPYLQAPWNTTEFLIDHSGHWIGRYTAIHSGGLDGRRMNTSDESHRVLVVRHSVSQGQRIEIVDIATGEIEALGKALLAINGS